MSTVSPPEKAEMFLWDLIARECGSEAIELINQKIDDTWKRIERKYGDDIAQEALCQAFEKVARGKVEKPLHYAAKSARRIDKDEGKRERFLHKYQVSLPRVRWEKGVPPEENDTDEAPRVEFQKTPPEARIYRNPVSEVEAGRLLREIKHDSILRRLISHTGGENVKMSASQVSKARARVLKRVLAE